MKECYEVLINLNNVKKQITQFGITEEGLFVYNEDNQLSELLNMDITPDTEVVLVVEGLSEQISKIKEKLKEKWEKFKESFGKKNEVITNKFDEMMNELDTIINKLNKKNFILNDEIDVEGVTFSHAKKIVSLAIDVERNISQKSLVKKTKAGVEWIDLSHFQETAKELKVGFAIKKLKSGIIEFKPIPGYRYKFYPMVKKEGTIKELGWNENTIKAMIELFKKAYDVFKTNYNALKLRYTVYSHNMYLLDNTEDDSDLEDIIYNQTFEADFSLDLMDDIVSRLEQIIMYYSDMLVSMINKTIN